MAARRRDLQRALGDFLPLHLLEVGAAHRRFDRAGLRRRQGGRALEMVEQAQEIGRGDHLHLPRPGSFGALRRGADQPHFLPARMERGEQDAGRGRGAPVQPQFAHDDIARQRFGIDHAHGAQQRQRDRQVEMRAFLWQVGGREIDGDALGRQRQADRGNGVAHALAAFGHRLVGKADEDEIGQARHQLALHLHGARLQPQIGHRRNRCDQ